MIGSGESDELWFFNIKGGVVVMGFLFYFFGKGGGGG